MAGDVKPLTAENVGQIAERYEAARVMPHYITAAKRVHIGKSDWMEDWWVGWGKDDSCQIEGTPNHWRWLAMLILGLGEPNEAPYSEDKPTPEIVPQLLAAIEADRETIRELKAALGGFDPQEWRSFRPDAAKSWVLSEQLEGWANHSQHVNDPHVSIPLWAAREIVARLAVVEELAAALTSTEAQGG